MIYLADWKSAIDEIKQITNIKWKFNHFGPYVDDVIIGAIFSDVFEVERTVNIRGNSKEIIALRDPNFVPKLSEVEKKILDHVIEATKNLNWNEFIKLVYSTFPVMTGVRGGNLDLLRAAQRYKRESNVSAA